MTGNTNAALVKPKVIQKTTLKASNWDGNVYSFEAEYPSSKWDVQIEANSNLNEESVKAYSMAKIVTSADLSNKCVALGTVPTVDIDIILRATKK